MYCSNCGKGIEEGDMFCGNCGAKLIEITPQKVTEQPSEEEKNTKQPSEEEKNIEQPVNEPKESVENTKQPGNSSSFFKSFGKKQIIALVVAVLVVVTAVGSVGYVTYQKKHRWENWVTKYQKSFQELYMSEEEKKSYNDYIAQATEAKSSAREELKKKMEDFQKKVQEENDAYIKTIEANISKIEKDYDLSYALKEEKEEIEESKKAYEALKKKREYPAAIEETKKCMELEENASKIREGWNLTVLQKDVSAYPKVKLYCSVEDNFGNAIEYLTKDYIFLSQKNEKSNTYKKHKIENAAQLNEKENLNINLVADVSGSMSGNMDATKQVMNRFLDTVQFNVGDEVGLIAFDDVSYILQDFTNDKSSISEKIYGMSEGGMTKLYDTLIEAVQTVVPQSGAKCVIAFTDGYDNRSASSVQDVIDYANLYDVPIFIIGIGDEVDSVVLENIASSTGGEYTSVAYVDSSFENIYSEIYRIQKEVYCIEYVVDDDNMNNPQDISIYARNAENGGTTNYQYTASWDYFGIVVQQYLTTYIEALTAGNPSILDQCEYLNSDGGIAKDVKKYIKDNKDSLAEQLLSSEVTHIQYKDKNTYIIETEEVYDIQQQVSMKKVLNSKRDDEKAAISRLEDNGYEIDLLKEENATISIHKMRKLKGHYVVKRNKGKWQLCDYAANYDVLESEVYTAYPYDDWSY